MISRVEKLFNKSTIFIIDNKFVLLNLFMMFVHIIIASWFYVIGVQPLFAINTISSIIYGTSTFLSSTGKELQTPYISFFEIIIQASFAVYYVGWDCGFAQFIIASIPIVIYSMSMINDASNKQFGIAIGMSLCDFIAYVLLRHLSIHKQPVYTLHKDLLDALFIYAAIWMYISIIACCFIYAIENRRITENLKAKNSALTADAQKDPLTGLLNRRGFMPIITKLCKEDKKFSVAICDIDDFKKVNDTYGHDAGDQVLKEITALVKSESHSAEVCRWGGEEIVILFDGLGLEKATRELEHIRERVQDYVVSFCDKTIKVTITIGVEQNMGDYDKADDAIAVADKRLYYGKHHGKNVVINKDFEDDAVETNQSA